MTAPTPSQPGRRGARALAAALLVPVLGALLASLFAGLFTGLALLAASPAQAAAHQVRIQQYAYGPSGLSIKQGDTVTWTNFDTVEHDVYVTNGPEAFHSPMLGKGESWSHTFSTAGSYSYICSVHPDMRASISVAAAAPPPAASASTAGAPTTAQTPAQTTAGATRTHASGKGHHGATTTTAAAPPAATTTTTTPAAPAVVPAATTATLDPLLIVAGASVAVVVFCLLLMASRPAYEPTPEPAHAGRETVPKPNTEVDTEPNTQPEDSAHAASTEDETKADLKVG